MLTQEFTEPIVLIDGAYEIALRSLSTYNFIPNIIKNKNDSFYFASKSMAETLNKITIPEGTYEIHQIEEKLNELGKQITPTFNIEIKADNTSMKSSIKCTEYITFQNYNNSIHRLLGFDDGLELHPYKWHTSQRTVDIFPTNIIRVACNLARGSYMNGKETHVLYTFFPNVAPGYKIVEQPSNLLYLPLNTSVVSKVQVKLIDQNDNLVNFRDETISITLEIKEKRI